MSEPENYEPCGVEVEAGSAKGGYPCPRQQGHQGPHGYGFGADVPASSRDDRGPRLIAQERWRVGAKVPINVYEGDRPVCQCQTALDARIIVEAVNARTATPVAVAELIARLQKMSVAVYLAAEEGPASDLSDGLRQAATLLAQQGEQLERQPAFLTDYERMWDLVRYARGYLQDEGLITRKEYTDLVSAETVNRPGQGSPAPRRLENYDEISERLVQAESQAESSLRAMTEALQACRTALETIARHDDWQAVLGKQPSPQAIAREALALSSGDTPA